MRSLMFVLVVLAWAMPAVADSPTAGDVFFYLTPSGGEACKILHLDPKTGSSHVASQWGCGSSEPSIGSGPTDWSGDDTRETLHIQPDGWIYLHGLRTTANLLDLYRVHPVSGDRELIAALPLDRTRGLAFWPEPSFFPPSVATLSIGAVVLLVGVLGGLAVRRRE